MQTTTILVVDDDDIILEVLIDALHGHYRVIPATSGARCLEILRKEQPDLILMDVEMPGMDGYETCSRIKNEFASPPPVIFISSHDALQDRLKGYGVGGDDYVVKPFVKDELLLKIAAVLKFVDVRKELKEQVNFASSTAMTAMTSMGEIGTLLEVMKCLHASRDLQGVAKAASFSFKAFGLDGIIMLRGMNEEFILASHGGEPTPREVEAIHHVAGMGRIVEFRSRLSVSYEHVTLLLNNMPVNDAARIGRLRDHLAILAETLDFQMRSLMRDETLDQAVRRAIQALARIDEAQRHRRANTTQAIQEMTDSLERAYVSMALTDSQEAAMNSIVSKGMDRLLTLVGDERDAQQTLSEFIRELKEMTDSA